MEIRSVDMEEAVDIFPNSIQKKWSLKLCFSSKFVKLKYINYIVLEKLCIEVDGM